MTEYAPLLKNETEIFPDISEVIEELSKIYNLIIISSTNSDIIRHFLEKHKIVGCFQWILGNDVHENKTAKIEMVFGKYAVSARDCVFVTDTVGDVLEAKKVEVGSIGVTWGFHSHETLSQSDTFRLTKRPDELPGVIFKYFRSR